MTPEIGQLKSNFVDLFDSTTNTEVLTLAGELSSRKYYRILVKKPSAKEPTPTYVLQAAEAFSEAEPHPFLLAQQIFVHLGIRVPKIFGVAGQEGWILVEDCGDFFLQYRQESDLYLQAIDMLFLLQKCRNVDELELPEKIKNAPHFSWAFDFEKLNAEMLHTEKFFIAGLLKEDIPFANWLSLNTSALANRPRVLCHRDFHSRNLLVKDDLVYALDFQDARMGPVSYDLVSLLWDPYANLKSDLRTQLISHWKKKTADSLLEDVDTEIHRMKIQRLLKAVGSYSSFYLDRGNPSTIPFIEGAIADSLDSLEALSDEGLLGNDEKKAHNWLGKTYKKIVGT
jgi:aminoglycoside/choline kinase family phosphotransferase